MLRKWLSDVDDSATVELLTFVTLVVDESVGNFGTDDKVLRVLKHDFDVAKLPDCSIVDDERTDSDVEEIVDEGRTESRSLLLQFQRLLKDELVFDC